MNMLLTVDSEQFGKITATPDSVISFVKPILGFSGYNQFVIVEDKELFPIQWIQSVEDSGLAFPIINPYLLNLNYKIDLPLIMKEAINLNKSDEVLVFTLLVIPSSRLEDVRTNLKAPIIINPDNKQAIQLILDDPAYPLRYHLFRGQGANENNKTRLKEEVRGS